MTAILFFSKIEIKQKQWSVVSGQSGPLSSAVLFINTLLERGESMGRQTFPNRFNGLCGLEGKKTTVGMSLGRLAHLDESLC